MIPFLIAMDAQGLSEKVQATAINTPILVAQATEAGTSDGKNNSFPYASLQLGVGFPYDYTGSFELGGDTINTRLDLNTGFNGELAVGHQFNRVRTELGLGYGSYGVNKQTFDGAAASSDGNLQVTTLMVNGYYDVPIKNRSGILSRWSPYLGAGIGYANIDAPACSSNACFTGGSSSGFAYQGKLGLSYRVAERSFAFLEGGYIGATSGTIDGIDFDNFGAWRVNVGFRLGFGGSSKVAASPKTQESTPEAQPQPQAPIRGLW